MSLEQLKTERKELIEKLDQLQTESAERLFEIELDDRKQIKTIMEHLNKGFTWKTQNAAVVVALYDQLKKQYKELISTEEDVTTVKLRAHELNGLYQALLNVEGIGIEPARRFITMLTNVGETVTNAMTILGESNKEISKLHANLAELEQTISQVENVEEVEPQLEDVTLENKA